MNLERDKYLTEAMGEHWHEHTMTCGYTMNRLGEYISDIKTTSYTNDFSTWAGFGKLWDWASRQHILFGGYNSVFKRIDPQITEEDVNPNSFANAVYDYLKEKANDSTR